MKIFSSVRSFSSWLLVAAFAFALTVSGSAGAEDLDLACADSLAVAPLIQEIHLLWWPCSDAVGISHLALEVDSEVWESYLVLKKSGPAERFLLAARIKRGLLRIPIRVTEAELAALRESLEARRGRFSGGTCSSGLYSNLRKAGIFGGPALPAFLPTPLVVALMIRRALGDSRIGSPRWVGRKSGSGIYPYPKNTIHCPLMENYLAFYGMYFIDRHSPDLAHDLITRGQDLYHWLYLLMH